MFNYIVSSRAVLSKAGGGELLVSRELAAVNAPYTAHGNVTASHHHHKQLIVIDASEHEDEEAAIPYYYSIEAFKLASNIGLTCYFVLAVLGTVLNLMVFRFLRRRASRAQQNLRYNSGNQLRRTFGQHYSSKTSTNNLTDHMTADCADGNYLRISVSSDQRARRQWRLSRGGDGALEQAQDSLPYNNNYAHDVEMARSRSTSGNFGQPPKSSSSTTTLLDFHIMNLSFAQLLVSSINCGMEVGWRITEVWIAGDVVCRVLSFIRPFSLYATSFIISSIAIDHGLAVKFPFSSVQGAYRRARKLMVGSWTLAVLCSLPQVFVFRLAKRPGPITFHQCMSRFNEDSWLRTAYVLYGLSIMYYIPTIIVIVCYAIIFISLCRRNTRSLTEGQPQHQTYRGTRNTGLLRHSQALHQQHPLFPKVYGTETKLAPKRSAQIVANDNSPRANAITVKSRTLLRAKSSSCINKSVHGDDKNENNDEEQHQNRNMSGTNVNENPLLSKRLLRASSADIESWSAIFADAQNLRKMRAKKPAVMARRTVLIRVQTVVASRTLPSLPPLTMFTCDRRVQTALRLSVAIVFAFVCCTIPYATTYLAHLIDRRTNYTWHPIVREVLLVFSVAHVIINPLLYGKQAFICCFCSSKSSNRGFAENACAEDNLMETAAGTYTAATSPVRRALSVSSAMRCESTKLTGSNRCRSAAAGKEMQRNKPNTKRTGGSITNNSFLKQTELSIIVISTASNTCGGNSCETVTASTVAEVLAVVGGSNV